MLEPHGDQIRIDDVRELRHDLHMRPFEADRRVYLIFDAHLLNADAADALLKDLEEPPPYAVVVLVADELGPLPETIRSRCQLVPFRRLSERAIRAEVERLAPGLSPDEQTAVARVAAGRLDRVVRLLDPDAARRRTELLAVATRGLRRSRLRPDRGGAGRARARGRARGPGEGRCRGDGRSARASPTARREQHVKRAERGAEREEILLALEELHPGTATWSSSPPGAERAVVHYDRLAELAEDGTAERMPGAERAAEVVRGSWRTFEEFNVAPQLALEAMFVRVRRELAACRRPSEQLRLTRTGGVRKFFGADCLSRGKPLVRDHPKGES